MDSLSFTFQPVITSNIDSLRHPPIQSISPTIGGSNCCNVRTTSNINNRRFASVTAPASLSNPHSEEEPEGSVEEVRIPKAWLNSSKALEVISIGILCNFVGHFKQLDFFACVS